MKTIALVGRPNVGKSSLFNALLRYRRSIVMDSPGTTLDRIIEKVRLPSGFIRLADSQGILSEEDLSVLDRLVVDSDAFVFLTELPTGATPFDRLIASRLRASGKPTLLVANKAECGGDGFEHTVLGMGTPLEISVSHRTGFEGLFEWLEKFAESEKETKKAIEVAIIGRPNAGKSTLMNRLCGERVSRVSARPLTTRDAVSSEVRFRNETLRLLDTAGMRRPRSKKADVEVFSIQGSTRAIRSSDVVVLMIPSHETISDQDMRLLSLAQREGKPTLVLFSFWDRLNAEGRREFLSNRSLRPWLSKFETIPMSGATGWNVAKLFPSVVKLYRQSLERASTSDVNRVVEKIVQKNPPPAAGNHNFNILYASQVSAKPPTFVFFMNRRRALPLGYQRYLKNEIAKEMGYRGQAVRLLFRTRSDAPK